MTTKIITPEGTVQTLDSMSLLGPRSKQIVLSSEKTPQGRQRLIMRVTDNGPLTYARVFWQRKSFLPFCWYTTKPVNEYITAAPCIPEKWGYSHQPLNIHRCVISNDYEAN